MDMLNISSANFVSFIPMLLLVLIGAALIYLFIVHVLIPILSGKQALTFLAPEATNINGIYDVTLDAEVLADPVTNTELSEHPVEVKPAKVKASKPKDSKHSKSSSAPASKKTTKSSVSKTAVTKAPTKVKTSVKNVPSATKKATPSKKASTSKRK